MRGRFDVEHYLHIEPDLVSFNRDLREGALDEFRSYYGLLDLPGYELRGGSFGLWRHRRSRQRTIARDVARNCAEFMLNEQSHRFHEILSVLRT